MTAEIHTSFTETDAGTQIRHRAEVSLGDSLFDRLVEPVAVSYNERQFRSHIQNTTELLEAEVAAGITPTA